MKKGSLLILILTMIACSDPPRTMMNDAEIKLFDSLYSHRASYVRKEVDSICVAESDRYFHLYVDSLKQKYIESIDDIESYLKSKQQ